MNLILRTTNVIRGLVSLVVSMAERRHPEALLELEKERLRRLMGQFNQGLASHAAMAERLIGKVQTLEGEERKLKSLVTAHLQAGNRDLAGRYALKRESTQQAIVENREHLVQAEKTYENLLKVRDIAIDEAHAKIASLGRSLGELKVRRATADLQELASGMVAELGGAGDTLDRLQEIVKEELAEAAGRSRVAAYSGNLGTLEDKDQNALAVLALSKFEDEPAEAPPAAIRFIPGDAIDANAIGSATGASRKPGSRRVDKRR